MQRTAHYICTGTSYCVVEDDMVTEIVQYKPCDLPLDDPEVGDTTAGTYDDSANTFTFDSGLVLQL